MHARLEGRQRGFIENELKSIELIEQFLTPVITLNHDSVTTADYKTLLYYMKVAMQREEKGEVCPKDHGGFFEEMRPVLAHGLRLHNARVCVKYVEKGM